MKRIRIHQSKRGVAVYGAVILLVIVIFSGVIIIGFTNIIRGGVVEGFPEIMCTLTSSIRGNAQIVGIKIWPELCETKVIDVDPADWKKCPTVDTSDLDFDNIEPYQLVSSSHYGSSPVKAFLKECAAEQVVNLATRCWSMRGRGAYDPGSLTCYYSCLQKPYIMDGELLTLKESVKLDEDEKKSAKNGENENLEVVGYTLSKDDILNVLRGSKTENKLGDKITYSSVLNEGNLDFVNDLESDSFVKITFIDDETLEITSVQTGGVGCSV